MAELWELGTLGAQALAAEAGQAVLLAYFPDQAGLEARLAGALAPLGGRAIPTEVPEVDWVARVREAFRAFTVGGFRIVPAWDVPAAGGGHSIVVEPGRAFGTGTHESTRLCLAALERRAAQGALGDVLDVGAGSGILSVAAVRLGARRVVAVEIDEEAIPVARRHARLNQAPVWLLRGDGARAVRPETFDTVLANISAPLLVERAEELSTPARPGGAVILSGFLSEDLASVRAAYQSRGRLELHTEGEWAGLVVERQP